MMPQGKREEGVRMCEEIKLRNMTGIYINRGKEMLMLYRIGSRVVEPSWCGIGGHFEEKELNNPRGCMLRELEEEIGLREEALENLQLRYVTLRLKNGEIRQNYYYFAQLKADAEVSLKSDEGRVEWVPYDQVMNRKMPLTARYMLAHYMEIGRFNDKLYSGTTTEDQIVFTVLNEF